MTTILYYSPGACSLAVDIVLEEIGAPFETVKVSTADGSNKQPAYLAVNPRGRIPALRVDGFTLTEVPAILTYLAGRHPEAGLLPDGGEPRARVLEWLSWFCSSLHVGFAVIWRPERFASDPDLQRRLVDGARDVILPLLASVEERVGDGPFLVGDGHTLADPYALVMYRWGNRIGHDMRAHYPRWTAHAERLEQRPAVRRALEREGISLWR
jgi:glutathione S-transferase